MLLAGLDSIAASLFASNLAFTMETALTRILAHASEDGLVMIAVLPFVHKIATTESAWHQILANVASGTIHGEMGGLGVEFRCSKSQMVIHN